MRINLKPLLLSVVALSAGAAPDTVYIDGRIYPEASGALRYQAMAVEDGRVLALGDNDSIAELADAQTQIVELEGRSVLPGFNDQHVHPMGAGLDRNACRIASGATLAQLQASLSACVARTEPGQWVRGSQWDAAALGEVPVAAHLDQVAPENPVMLIDTSGHSVWVNSRAMELAQLNRESEVPKGGIVEKLADGAPSGVLRESAISLVSRVMPGPDRSDLQAALGKSIDELARYGITSYTEAAVGYLAGVEMEMDAIKAYADEHRMPLRARICLTWSPATGLKESNIDALIAARNHWSSENLTVDCIKIFLDGVPTDSHTAAMLEPYQDKVAGRDAGHGDTGIVMVPQDELNEAVARFDRLGLTVKYHAAGDAAVRAGLDAIAYARRVNGYYGPLHDVGHATFVDTADLHRARNIGATIEASPYLFSPAPINDSIIAAVGEPRIKRVWPVRDALDAGALVVAGSDWAVVPSVNPWIAVETLITRQKPGGSQESFYGGGQGITLDEALAMFTRNAARHMRREHELGVLQPGFLADFVVIDRDPWTTPVHQLHQTRVDLTVVGGKPVYRRP